MSTRSAATGSPYPTPPLLVGIVTLSVLSSAALTTGAILGGQAWRRRRLREGLKDEAERDLQDFTSSDPKDSKTPEDNLDDDLDFATGEERASSSRLESTFSTSGISTPARGLTSTHASTPGGGAKANDPLGKEWKRGEYDEELVREQVSGGPQARSASRELAIDADFTGRPVRPSKCRSYIDPYSPTETDCWAAFPAISFLGLN